MRRDRFSRGPVKQTGSEGVYRPYVIKREKKAHFLPSHLVSQAVRRLCVRSNMPRHHLSVLQSHRRITNPESMDLESETSSVCSERSFSTNANRQMHLDNWELSEALKNCQSSQWSERKDGLVYMQAMFKNRRSYTMAELKKICDAFSRLFVDQHTKVWKAEEWVCLQCGARCAG